jgi:hypothetical protein
MLTSTSLKDALAAYKCGKGRFSGRAEGLRCARVRECGCVRVIESTSANKLDDVDEDDRALRL